MWSACEHSSCGDETGGHCKVSIHLDSGTRHLTVPLREMRIADRQTAPWHIARQVNSDTNLQIPNVEVAAVFAGRQCPQAFSGM